MNASEKNKKRNRNYKIRPKENEGKEKKGKKDVRLCSMDKDSILQELQPQVQKEKQGVNGLQEQAAPGQGGVSLCTTQTPR